LERPSAVIAAIRRSLGVSDAAPDSATPYQFDLPDYPSFDSMFKRERAVSSLPRALVTGVLR
jgi:hypothetical protein